MNYVAFSLKQALEIRKATKARVMAGGTDLMVSAQRGEGMMPRFEGDMLLISHVDELRHIGFNASGELEIGALCTSAQIAGDSRVPWALRAAASRMGAVALRNCATIGGNIANASPKGDLPGPLYALDARVRLLSVDGAEEMLVSDFILGLKKTKLKDDQIIGAIIIPKMDEWFDYIFWHKIGTRRANAISKLTVTMAIKLDQQRKIVEDFRLSATACGAKTNRSREVESLVIGKKVQELEDLVAPVQEAFDKVISPRAMPVFRRTATKNMIADFFSRVARLPEERNME
ncbi:MAG: FAD binding domain-containing protein [Sphaerochaetaceae bacterium]|nr:FAD binding domain-containing protein [Sphaerochaetaceae bacterium]